MLGDWTFLGIFPSLLGCPFYWWVMIFCVSVVSVLTSHFWFYWFGPSLIFLHEFGQRFINFLKIFSKTQLFSFINLLLFRYWEGNRQEGWGLQMEETGKCQTFSTSLLSGRRKQTTSVFPFVLPWWQLVPPELNFSQTSSSPVCFSYGNVCLKLC